MIECCDRLFGQCPGQRRMNFSVPSTIRKGRGAFHRGCEASSYLGACTEDSYAGITRSVITFALAKHGAAAENVLLLRSMAWLHTDSSALHTPIAVA